MMSDNDEAQLEQLSRSNATARMLIDLVDNEDAPRIYSLPAGKAPASPSLNLYDMDMDEDMPDAVEQELDGDEEILEHREEYAREFKRSLQCDEQYVSECPDLNEYFSNFELDETQVIAMCRTYANYLAQRIRSRLPRHLQKVKRVKVAKK